MAILQTPAPTVTPYLSPKQGGNPNVPVGQTGVPYSQNFIGPPIPMNMPVGTPIVGDTSKYYNLTPPKQNPTPQPSNNSGGVPKDSQGANVGNVRNFDGRNYAWNGNAWEPYRDSTWEGTDNGFDLNAAIDEAYAPAYANLQGIQAQYEAQYPTSQKMLEQSYAEQVPTIQGEQTSRLQNVEAQRTKGKAEQSNQIAKSRQLFNELRQSGLNRFGGSSSTGEATQELLGRSVSEQMGGINQNFGSYYTQLDNEAKNINDFYTTQLSNLEKEKGLKLEQLKNDFQAQIQSINSQRAALDSEKAARRLAAVQEYSAQARQMAYDQQVFQRNLDMWKAYKDEVIQTAKQFGAKSFTMPGLPGVLGGYSVSGIGGQGNGNQYATDQDITYYKNQYPDLNWTLKLNPYSTVSNKAKDENITF